MTEVLGQTVAELSFGTCISEIACTGKLIPKPEDNSDVNYDSKPENYLKFIGSGYIDNNTCRARDTNISEGETCEKNSDCKKGLACLADPEANKAIDADVLENADYCSKMYCSTGSNNEPSSFTTSCSDGYKCVGNTTITACIIDENFVEPTDEETSDEDTAQDLSCLNNTCESHDDCPCDADVCLPPQAPNAVTNVCVAGGCDVDDPNSCPEGMECVEFPEFVQEFVKGYATVCQTPK